jgi:hypothetical protein
MDYCIAYGSGYTEPDTPGVLSPNKFWVKMGYCIAYRSGYTEPDPTGVFLPATPDCRLETN